MANNDFVSVDIDDTLGSILKDLTSHIFARRHRQTSTFRTDLGFTKKIFDIHLALAITTAVIAYQRLTFIDDTAIDSCDPDECNKHGTDILGWVGALYNSDCTLYDTDDMFNFQSGPYRSRAAVIKYIEDAYDIAAKNDVTNTFNDESGVMDMWWVAATNWGSTCGTQMMARAAYLAGHAHPPKSFLIVVDERLGRPINVQNGHISNIDEYTLLFPYNVSSNSCHHITYETDIITFLTNIKHIIDDMDKHILGNRSLNDLSW